MVQVNIKNLIDDAQCYQTVRELRWPDGVECPSCKSTQVIKRGFHDTEPDRQRYECTDCHTRFVDDLTDTVFAGHHQPLKVWILCLYFMGMKTPRSKLRGIKRCLRPANQRFADLRLKRSKLRGIRPPEIERV
jgi:transposase-like protein